MSDIHTCTRIYLYTGMYVLMYGKGEKRKASGYNWRTSGSDEQEDENAEKTKRKEKEKTGPDGL